MQTCLAMSTPGNMTFYYSLQQGTSLAYLQFYWAELDQNVNVTSRQFEVHVPSFIQDTLVNVYNDSHGLYQFF